MGLRAALEKTLEEARASVHDETRDFEEADIMETVTITETVRIHSKAIALVAGQVDPQLEAEVTAASKAARERMPSRLDSAVIGGTVVVRNLFGQLAELVAADRESLRRVADALVLDVDDELDAAGVPGRNTPESEVGPLLRDALAANEAALLAVADALDERGERGDPA